MKQNRSFVSAIQGPKILRILKKNPRFTWLEKAHCKSWVTQLCHYVEQNSEFASKVPPEVRKERSRIPDSAITDRFRKDFLEAVLKVEKSDTIQAIIGNAMLLVLVPIALHVYINLVYDADFKSIASDLWSFLTEGSRAERRSNSLIADYYTLAVIFPFFNLPRQFRKLKYARQRAAYLEQLLITH